MTQSVGEMTLKVPVANCISSTCLTGSSPTVSGPGGNSMKCCASGCLKYRSRVSRNPMSFMAVVIARLLAAYPLTKSRSERRICLRCICRQPPLQRGLHRSPSFLDASGRRRRSLPATFRRSASLWLPAAPWPASIHEEPLPLGVGVEGDSLVQ